MEKDAEFVGLVQPLLHHGFAPGAPTPSSSDVEAAAPAAVAAAWAGPRELLLEEPPTQFVQSSLWDTTINLTNAILGAGMLAMPRAFAGLGVLGGGEWAGRCGVAVACDQNVVH